MVDLAPRLDAHHTDADRAVWLAYAKFVIEWTIQHLESSRHSPTQQTDWVPNPAFLPPTYELKLWLLEYPQLKLRANPEQDRQIFADQLVSEMRSLLTLGLAHHHQLTQLMATAMRVLPAQRARVALELAGPKICVVTDEGEIRLRVGLAGEMLRGMKVGDGEREKAKVARMVKGWRLSGVEDVRVRGFEMAAGELGMDKG